MSRRNENRPGYKKTKVGWIPEEWDCVRIKKVSDINPEALSDKTDLDYMFHYIDLSTVNEGKLNLPSNKIAFREAPSRARRKVKKNDVLLATVRPNLKGFAYISFEANDIVCSTGYAVLRSKNEVISLYLFYNLFSHETERYFYSCVVGSNYPALNNSDVNNLRIPLPPLSEQKKIAEILSAWDRAIELVGRLIDAKQRLKKGLMQQLLTGRMRFPEFGKPVQKKGGLPEGWKGRRLSSFGSFLKGKGITNSEKKESGLPCITYGEIYTKHDFVIRQFFSFIDKNVSQKSQRIQRNDILFAGSGETLDEIGKCVAYTKDVEAYAGGDVVIFRPKGVNPLYLSYSLNSDLLIRQKRKLGQGHSVVHIYSAGLKTLQVPLPSLAEQTRIAAILSACDREIELLKKKQKKLREQKKGLMQKLLTGEIRVKV